MAGTIQGLCVTGTPYTGTPRCEKTESTTDALIFHDPKARYPLDPETFIDGLDEWVYDTGLNRIYPVGGVLYNAESGGDVNTYDTGSGFASPTTLAQKITTFTIDGGDCLYKQLAKLEGRTWRVFRVDVDGYIYGTVVDDQFAGFLCKVKVRRLQATGSDAYQLYLDVYYTNKLEKEEKNLHAFEIGNAPEGLVPVVVKAVTGGSQVVGECSQVDYTSNYANEWTAPMFTQATGTAAESVTYNATTGLLTIAPAGTYRVADASVLADAGITGLTGVPL